MTQEEFYIKQDLKSIRDVIFYAGYNSNYKLLIPQVEVCKQGLLALSTQAQTNEEKTRLKELTDKANLYLDYLNNVKKWNEKNSEPQPE